MTLFFGNDDSVVGMGMTVFEEPPTPLQSFWLDNGDGTYSMVLTFRNDTCSGSTDAGSIGDQVVINQDGVNPMNVPLSATDAQDAGWTAGSCIKTMGVHWGYDITGTMTWNSDTLLPLIPMYDYTYGNLSALMFNFPHPQRVEPFGIWEGPIPGPLMCKNFCSSDCNSFNCTSFYSTLHVWTTDYKEHTCPSTIYCPPSDLGY